MFSFLEPFVKDDALTLEQFAEAISPCATIVDSAIRGELRVPDFEVHCCMKHAMTHMTLDNVCRACATS
jgi:hypothetical protein